MIGKLQAKSGYIKTMIDKLEIEVETEQRLRYVPIIACIFLTLGSGWFSLFQSGGTKKTSVVPNCSKAMAFQKDIQLVRAVPAS